VDVFPTPAAEEGEEIGLQDPTIIILDRDFGDIVCPRENLMAIPYVAAQRGHKKYKSSKLNLATRWQFESTSKLIELINDPEKMDKEACILNGSIGGPPSTVTVDREIPLK
jgi:hypothetical protein